MSKYKLIVTDLDGTAVPVNGTEDDISTSLIDASNELHKRGKFISVATGRSYDGAERIAVKLGVKCPIVLNSGTQLINPSTGSVVWEKTLSAAAERSVVEVFRRHSPNSGYIASNNVNYLGEERLTPMQVKLSSRGSRFLYLVGSTDETAMEKIANAINTDNSITAIAHVTNCWLGPEYYDVHVTHPLATKAHAVEVIQQALGVTKEETIGIGDSGNDIPLIEHSGFGVAMGNANDTLKSLADYIAPRQEDDALAHVIKKFML